VKLDSCDSCHGGIDTSEDLQNIRMTQGDLDLDGDEVEGIAGEIKTLHEYLYQAMQDYTLQQGLPGIIWSASSYPYYFIDINENGEGDPDELNFSNQYSSWTP